MKDVAVLVNSNATWNRKQSDDRACVGAICRVTSSGTKHGYFDSFPLRLSCRGLKCDRVKVNKQTLYPILADSKSGITSVNSHVYNHLI